MPKAILATALAMTMAVPAMAQTASSLDRGRESAVSTYRYTSDYEVASWPVEDRVRPAPRDPNTLQSNDDLLGGPVPEVERHQVSATSSEAMRVVMTDTTRSHMSAAGAGDLPGRQAEDRFGTSLGRIAVIERDSDGSVSAAWVQPPYAEGNALRKIEVNAITLRGGRVVVERR